jgi:predicted outer membrane repeat protein
MHISPVRVSGLPAWALVAGALTFPCTPAVEAGIIVVPNTWTVGTGGGPPCDFSNVDDAVNAAASGETIRVNNDISWFTAVGLQIANKSLTLEGGYSDCADDTPDPDQPSSIGSVGFSTMLTVSNAIAGVPTVLIRHITLHNGDGGATKGGTIDLSGGVLLRLDNVDVQDGRADYGGGIRIHGGPPIATLRLEGGTRIGGVAPFVVHNNAFQQGGGIYCDGSGVIEWVDASITFNTALHGGGIFMNGCSLTMPEAAGADFRVVEIRGNQALGSGGGIYGSNNASLSMNSSTNRQVRIDGNQADVDGGGIFLSVATLDADGVQIEENEAGNYGGGLYLSQSSAGLDRGNPSGADCPTRERCATLSRNLAGVHGAAAYLIGGTQLDLRQVFVESNAAVNMPGMLVTGASTLVLRDVQFAGNAGLAGAELIFASDSTLELRHVSSAFNTVARSIRTIGGSNVTIHDSILWQAEGTTTLGGDGTAVLDLSCNSASENATLPGAATHSPGFLDGDALTLPLPVLQLAADSANVDACDDAPAPNPAFDAVGSPRVVDATDVADQAGPLDRGALEYQPPIFIDGFEDK